LAENAKVYFVMGYLPGGVGAELCYTGEAMTDSSSNGLLTNDNADLVPVTSFDTPDFCFDFPGLEVGVAEYDEGPTGCTVFVFPRGATMVADIRGGSPGTMLSHREGWVDAICLAGGSVYGFEAAAGVSCELLAAKRYDTDWMNIAIVPSAVIFDFNSRRKNRAIHPDKRLGRAAFRARREGAFPPGARGAGRCATVGKWLKGRFQPEPGGQGAAFHQSGEARVAVFTVVNSVGAIVGRDGRVVRGHLDQDTGEHRRVAEVAPLSGAEGRPEPTPGNTTLTLAVTNQTIPAGELRQVARQVHASMARAIDPFHTVHDGDVLYAVTTNQVDPPALDSSKFAQIASELAWDAVLRSF
jgi:L-aminopeptidase/D-esterase-like protein